MAGQPGAGSLPDTTNPCLAAQLAWAAGATGGAAGNPVPVYVNTANPGAGGSWSWPASNVYGGNQITNPYGTCAGTATAACAYIYGYALAFEDANHRGVPDPAQRMWWLDVETLNSWSSDTGANTAVLEGMTAYLESIGASVGIYSTGYQFGEIAGVIDSGSNLDKLNEWIAGADSVASAQANCAADPLTPGGTITQTQFTTESFDYNITCPNLPPTPAPITSGAGQGVGSGSALRDPLNPLDLGAGLFPLPAGLPWAGGLVGHGD
ncbi:MAG TPA: hypothetical protein VLJ40_01990 [Arthrobacter sp.]|nr:hypothetical protein [Arthrobacter sp.]